MTKLKLYELEGSENTRLVEVYGSLLNSKQREEMLKKGGRMEEAGKVERRGWKLSFDRYSKKKRQAVLNLVYTGRSEDVYYTTVYRIDNLAYIAVMEREMGKLVAQKWRHGKEIHLNSYRPIQLNSELGITDIFIIPREGRQLTPTESNASYVKIVREGIEESYCGLQRKVNLRALERAITESQRSSLGRRKARWKSK